MTSSKSIPQPAEIANQLSLFTFQIDERIRRIEVHGIVYFSILDTFEYSGSVGSAKNPSKYWGVAKRNLEKQGAEVLTQVLQHRFEGQGQRDTPIAPFKFFLRLAEVVDIVEWEDIRQWMADVAHERIEESINPELGIQRARHRAIDTWMRQGKDEEWIETRFKGIDTFKALTSTIQHLCDAPRYSDLINTEYIELFGSTATQLQHILHTKSIRDSLSALQLSYLETTERAIMTVIQHKDRMTQRQLIDAFISTARPLGISLQEVCRQVGVDRVTGHPLLQSVRGEIHPTENDVDYIKSLAGDV